jgi:predicted CxxxxCH...CXXCH cytochrome family protein
VFTGGFAGLKNRHSTLSPQWMQDVKYSGGSNQNCHSHGQQVTYVPASVQWSPDLGMLSSPKSRH